MKLRINFLAGVALICFTGVVEVTAAPIFGESRTFPQPDGSTVTVILNGDEFYMRGESEDGYTVVRDQATGWICYAKISADGQDLISTGVPYRGTHSTPGAAQLLAGAGIPSASHLDLSPDNRMRKVAAVKNALGTPQWGADSAPAPSASNAPDYEPLGVNDAVLPPRKSDLTKYNRTVHGIVLLFDFPDAPAGASPTFQALVDSINRTNFHKANGRPASLRTFFDEVSRGTFVVSNFVFGIYRATNTFAYYDSLGYGAGAKMLMEQGLQQLESSGFDFSQLTVDSSHVVQDLCVMYTGSPANWAQGMWFHSGGWTGPTYDGVSFRGYCTTTLSSDPGTLIHEHGHLVAGWPDLYSYNSVATGVWDVMSGGATDLPNPFLLYENGWLDAVNIAGDYGVHTMNSLDAHNALVYYDPVQPQEYYFIRPYVTGLLYCADIPDQGLSLWRINTQIDGNGSYPNDPLGEELIHVNGSLDNITANVLFKASGRNRYTDTTIPGSRWAYFVRHGQRSGFNLTGISAPGSTMSFRLSRPIYFYPVSSQVNTSGVPASVQVTAAADTAVVYNAANLPPGLSINAATGLISGTPTTAGGYTVSLTATDTEGSQNTYEFFWLIGSGSGTTPQTAWYAFSGNLNDSSGNGRTGTAVGVPVFTNNAVEFNGSNNAVIIPRIISGDFTIAFFVKTSVKGGSGSQWYNGAGLVDGEVAGAAADFGVSLTSDRVSFGVGSPDTTLQSQHGITDGQWHHVAVTRKTATGAMALYIDGILDGTVTGPTGTRAAPPNLRIGSLQTGGNFFTGRIDEVRIYAAAIPADEIYRLSGGRSQIVPVPDQMSYAGNSVNLTVPAVNSANLTFSATGLPSGLSIDSLSGVISGVAPVAGVYNVTVMATSPQSPECFDQFVWAVCSSNAPNSLVAWYPLAGNVNDYSGFNRNGTSLGGPVFSTVGLRFDGTNDVVQIPRSISGDFTISFFLNAGAFGNAGSQWYNGMGLVDGEVAGAANDFGVSLTSDRISFGVGSTGGDTTIQSVNSVVDRLWHHVAVTRSSASGAIAIYLDGKLNKTGTASTGVKTSPPVLRIGSLQTAINYYSGAMAEVKLYSRVLAAEEIFRDSKTIASDPGYSILQTVWSLPASANLKWSAAPGEAYQVEWTSDLKLPFGPVGAPALSVSEYNLSRDVSVPGAAGFYRLRKL